MRMADEQIPKQLLYGELAEGKRSHGGQKKLFKDCLKAFGIDTASWETLAQDRSPWCSAIQKGSQTAELRRTAEAQKKRELRKTRAVSTGSSAPTHACPCVEILYMLGLASSAISEHTVYSQLPRDVNGPHQLRGCFCLCMWACAYVYIFVNMSHKPIKSYSKCIYIIFMCLCVLCDVCVSGCVCVVF